VLCKKIYQERFLTNKTIINDIFIEHLNFECQTVPWKNKNVQFIPVSVFAHNILI